MYKQDYDEMYCGPYFYYQGTSVPAGFVWWPAVLDPYVKSKQVKVCPSHSAISNVSTFHPSNFDTPGVATMKVSYMYNQYVGWRHESAIDEPARIIVIAEGYITQDYGGGLTRANPYLYNVAVADCGASASMSMRYNHNDGFNALYCDGHVKWHKRASTALQAWSPDGISTPAPGLY